MYEVGMWKFLLLMVVALSGCSLGQPRVDLVISPAGCDKQQLTLAPDRKPELLVRNTATEPMVVSLPNWNNSITLAPGEMGTLALEPYVWGDVEYYCLTEANHTAAGGGPMAAGFICGIDAYDIRPRSLSSGLLSVQQHNRKPIGAAQTFTTEVAEAQS
jgi:hypothetical protein